MCKVGSMVMFVGQLNGSRAALGLNGISFRALTNMSQSNARIG